MDYTSWHILSLLIYFVCVCFLEIGIHYVAQAVLEVTIFLLVRRVGITGTSYI